MSSATGSLHALHATIRGKFRNSDFPELRHVRISGGPDRVVLRGTVASYYLKAMAGAVALTVPEVLQVDNQIQVG